MDSIIDEGAIDLPISFCLKPQPGNRYQLALLAYNDGQLNEEYYNFYEGEQLYMHVDQGTLTFILAKDKQKPESIKARLKRLIFGQEPQESTVITRASFNWKKHGLKGL